MMKINIEEIKQLISERGILISDCEAEKIAQELMNEGAAITIANMIEALLIVWAFDIW